MKKLIALLTIAGMLVIGFSSTVVAQDTEDATQTEMTTDTTATDTTATVTVKAFVRGTAGNAYAEFIDEADANITALNSTTLSITGDIDLRANVEFAVDVGHAKSLLEGGARTSGTAMAARSTPSADANRFRFDGSWGAMPTSQPLSLRTRRLPGDGGVVGARAAPVERCLGMRGPRADAGRRGLPSRAAAL